MNNLNNLTETEPRSVALTRYNQENQKILYFQFNGKLSHADAEHVLNECEAIHHQSPDTYIHIWDCSKMTGFEMSAKNIWMEKLQGINGRIEKIFMISDNIIFRGTARIISKFTNLKLDVYKSIHELRINENIKVV